MNKAMIVLAVLPFLAPILPNAALAVSDRYMVGWNIGLHDAQNGVYNGCGDHNKEFCQGYSDGYNANIGNFNNGQSSSVNMKGDNNSVTINQGQANSFGSDSSNLFKGQLPRCVLFCIGIQH